MQKFHTQKNTESQKDDLISSLSHDLRNPIIAQIKILELFLKKEFGSINSYQSEILETLLDSSKSMYSMLSSVLEACKNEEKYIKLCHQEISGFELVKQCCSEIIYLAKSRNISINLVNNSFNNKFLGDEIQIKRVIMNLLINGIKYSYENTCMNLKIYNDETYVYFEFETNSPYITIENQNRIFDKYFSISEENKTNSIGLGLYLSKKIIEGHCGEIHLKSYKENRNIFEFKIPHFCPKNSQIRIIEF